MSSEVMNECRTILTFLDETAAFYFLCIACHAPIMFSTVDTLFFFFFLPCLVIDNFARAFYILALFSLSLNKYKYCRYDGHATGTVVG